MPLIVFASLTSMMFGLLLSLVAVFMILIVLVQRGRGGGLAGALGGMGGSSAFGAKAGDVFTRITAIAALVWIVLCIAANRWGAASSSRLDVQAVPGAASSVDLDDAEEVAPAGAEAAVADKSGEAASDGPALGQPASSAADPGQSSDDAK